ncbi:MAG: tetratricopeptide repeat protein, partial [Leptolyngbyaceae cyanobacterium RM1_405_57]|nr:tetratricopeptide repeat protein [Leptolyngbyaceae cyanobacterium RM1_405_57]
KTYAEESHYTQVKANALKGLGELHLIKGEFKGAIAHLLSAKKLLIEIEAKADLAEVHYQLGLTCRLMGSIAESEANFRAAIRLFQKIPAPKQVEKVQRAARPATAS